MTRISRNAAAARFIGAHAPKYCKYHFDVQGEQIEIKTRKKREDID
jgi:hypothetical protein